jgi:hypothetical protein
VTPLPWREGLGAPTAATPHDGRRRPLVGRRLPLAGRSRTGRTRARANPAARRSLTSCQRRSLGPDAPASGPCEAEAATRSGGPRSDPEPSGGVPSARGGEVAARVSAPGGRLRCWLPAPGRDVLIGHPWLPANVDGVDAARPSLERGPPFHVQRALDGPLGPIRCAAAFHVEPIGPSRGDPWRPRDRLRADLHPLGCRTHRRPRVIGGTLGCWRGDVMSGRAR